MNKTEFIEKLSKELDTTKTEANLPIKMEETEDVLVRV